MRYLLHVILLFCLVASDARAEGGQVVASIKPLHSLVAAVMAGDDKRPVLLVESAASLHSFSLKPSQMRALQNADIVFYMGESFERFLWKPFANLPQVKHVPMEKAPGITLYPVRLDHDDDTQRHAGYDLHLWLLPASAKAMVAEIERQLSALYPEKQALYAANAAELQKRIDAMDTQLAAQLHLLQGRPFIVFHDAYQYLEKAYGLSSLGAIALHPEQPLSAGHVRDLRRQLTDRNVRCVFREPQFDARIVENLVAGTGARSGVLDPEGASLTPGPELYFQLMESLADGLEECLR